MNDSSMLRGADTVLEGVGTAIEERWVGPGILFDEEVDEEDDADNEAMLTDSAGLHTRSWLE